MNKIKSILAVIATIGIFVAISNAGDIVFNPLALDNSLDLTTPSSTRDYPLGYEVTTYDPTKYAIKKFRYVYAPTALTKYGVYQVAYSSNTSQEWRAKTPASTDTGLLFGIPQVAFNANTYGFVQTHGDAYISVASNTTAGYLLFSNASATTSSSTTGGVFCSSAIAVAQETTYWATGATAAVTLFGSTGTPQ